MQGECDVSYVGQTRRKLITRINEHKKDVIKGSSNSVIHHHVADSGHQFDFINTRIIDKERSYTKRLISEMINIKRQKVGINRQSDTDLLSVSYEPLINSLHNV